MPLVNDIVLKTVLDTVAQGVVLFDQTRRLVTWNKHYEEVLRFPEGFLQQGMTNFEMALFLAKRGDLGEGDPEAVTRDRIAFLWNAENDRAEITIQNQRVYDVTFRRTEFGGLVVTYTDISDLKQVETELRAGESRLRQHQEQLLNVLNHSPIAVNILTQNGKRLFTNGRLSEVTGWSMEELLTKPADIFYADPNDRKKILADLRDVGSVYNREVRGVRKDGSRFWALMSMDYIIYQGENSILAWMYDITERKLAEKAHIIAKEEAELASRVKSEFLSVVSHELRTPLTSIKGSLAMLTASDLSSLTDKALRLTELATRNVERLCVLVDDLLDLDKIQAGRMEFSMAPIDAGELVTKSIDANQGYAHRLGVSLDLQPSPDGLSVCGDARRLEQVLANLLSNAAKYSPSGEKVFVSWQAYDYETDQGNVQGVRISVADVGPGIAEEFHSKIFQPFSQADQSTNRSIGGTGLGLSICKVIVENHNGRLGFETAVGKGSVFHLDLPTVCQP